MSRRASEGELPAARQRGGKSKRPEGPSRRCADDRSRTFRHAGDARSGGARARAARAPAAADRARARRTRPRSPRFSRDVDPAAVDVARGARAAAGDAQVASSLELQKALAPLRRPRGDTLGRGAPRCSPRPGPSTSPKARRPTTGGSPARCSRPAFARAISSTTASPTTSRRPARCSRPARTRSAARCFPAAPGRPSSRCRRWPTLAPTATSARRRSCKIILEKADELGVTLPSLTEGAGVGGSVPAEPARRVRRARHRTATRPTRPPTSAASPTRRRRARASSSTRACWSRSCARAPAIRWPPGEVGEVVVTHALQRRLSADPLRHRRPVGAAAGRRRRAGAPTCASRAGWAAPTRRPRSRACSCIRRRSRRSCRRHPEIARARLVVDNPDGNDRMTLHVEVPRQRVVARRGDRRVDPRRHQAARRGRLPRAGRAAERRQGDRRPAQATTRRPAGGAGSRGRLYTARGRALADGQRAASQHVRPTASATRCSRTRCAPSRRPASCARSRATRVLINEGDVGDSLYIILSGRVKVFASNEAGREFVIDFHGPGEYVGEMSLDGAPRSASVITVEPTTCAVVNRAQFRDFILAHPDFAMHLIERLIHRVRVTTGTSRASRSPTSTAAWCGCSTRWPSSSRRPAGRPGEADAAGHRRPRRRVARHDRQADEGPGRRRLPASRTARSPSSRSSPTGW